MGKDLKGKELGIGLCQRKDRRYSARVTIDGKRYEKIFNTITEARKWIAEPVLGAEYDLKDITLDEWYEIFYKSKEDSVSSSTLNNYEKIYRLYIKDKLGNKLVRKIKKIELQNVLNDAIKLGKSVSTVKIIRNILSVMFNVAVDNEIITTNPAYKLSVPKGKKKKVSAISKETQKKFVNSLDGVKYRLIFLLILETGLRIGEAIAIKWSDIDWEHRKLNIERNVLVNRRTRQVEIHHGKTETSIRQIPLTQKAIDILVEQKNNMPKIVNKEWIGYVFICEDGNIACDENVYATLQWVIEKNNLPKFSVHALRHTFATRCIEAGMKPKTLQVILGHSSITTTMNMYVDLMEDEAEKEMEKFERFFA